MSSMVLQNFPCGQPQMFRDLMTELKRFLGTETLFTVEESAEKVLLMRKAWDMGKDPLTIMRSSPHALSSALKLWLSCLPEPLISRELCRAMLQASAYLQGAELLRMLQQIFVHVDKAAMHVLYACVELLHHHRLNIRQPDQLAAVFAPLLLPERPLGAPAAGCEALVDVLISNYRTIFAGSMPMMLFSLPLDAGAAAAADAPALQQGALGGRQVVDALFGLVPLPEEEGEGCCACSEDGDDDDDMTIDSECAAYGDTAVPCSPGSSGACVDGADADGVVPEIERLLWGSLDGMLFEANDGSFLRRCEASFASLCTACGANGDSGSSLCDADSRAGSCELGAEYELVACRPPGEQQQQQQQAQSPTSILPGDLPFQAAGEKTAHGACAYPPHAPTWPAKHLRVCGGGRQLRSAQECWETT